jgi:tetratricopeptide (TPR) repeat protein
MRCKYLFTMISVVALLLIGVGAATAQVGELRGHVVMTQADGTTAPAPGATIDVFRTDIVGKWETKTDKHGDFVFAGLPYVGTYIVAVSAPNARPEAKGNVKVGRGDLPTITLIPGDGKRFTPEEAKAAGAGGAARAGGNESAADKAKREEIIKKNKEIEEKNKRNTDINEVIGRTFKAGNEALQAKNYDEAIKQFDEGLSADPEQAALYTQKSIALRQRGVDHYNASVKGSDQAAKAAEMENAKKDFQASAENAAKGVEFAKKEEPATDASALAAQNGRKLAAMSNRAESMRLYVKVDPSQADSGEAAYREYIAAETDAAKKTRAEHDLAQMLFDANVYDKARTEYEKILANSPEDPDALANMGLILFNMGAAKEGEGKKDEAKAEYQQAANYLQRFVDKAPDGYKFKEDAKAVLAELKNQQNVQAEKNSAPPRRKRP